MKQYAAERVILYSYFHHHWHTTEDSAKTLFERSEAVVKQILKKTLNITGTVLVILVVLFALLLVGARIFGIRAFTVLSGSMEPEYPVGSLIYVKETEPERIREGDVITFVLNEDLVVATHRVISVDTENQRFYTKGDANAAADGAPVHYKNLIGKPVFTIPYLGYAANFIQKPPGLYVAVAVAVVSLILAFFPAGKKKEKNMDINGREPS